MTWRKLQKTDLFSYFLTLKQPLTDYLKYPFHSCLQFISFPIIWLVSLAFYSSFQSRSHIGNRFLNFICCSNLTRLIHLLFLAEEITANSLSLWPLACEISKSVGKVNWMIWEQSKVLCNYSLIISTPAITMLCSCVFSRRFLVLLSDTWWRGNSRENSRGILSLE